MDLPTPAYESVCIPYPNQWEMMREQMSLIDYRLYLYYKYHQWIGPENDLRNMLGLVVTREEFEHNMLKAAQTALAEKLEEDELAQLALNTQAIELRIQKTEHGRIPLLALIERFQLDSFEQNCVLLAYAAALDEKYEKLFAYLQDDITKKEPTFSLAVSLFMEPDFPPQAYLCRLTAESIFTSLFDKEKRKSGFLVLSAEVISFLNAALTLPAGFRLTEPSSEDSPDALLVQQEIGQALDSLFSLPSCVGLLSGRSGSGRHFQIEQLCRRHNERCLFADLSITGRDPAVISTASMLARLTNSCLCLSGLETTDAEGNLEPPQPQLTEAIVHADLFRGHLFILSEKPLHLDTELPVLELELPELNTLDRLTLFRAFLAKTRLSQEVSLEELASKFHFTPRQIQLAARQAEGLSRVTGLPLTAEQLHHCCYRQAVHKLDALASRVQPGHNWDDLILPDAQKRLIRQACAHVRYQHQVYSQWGFEKKVSYGRGVSILFAGAPGTGKTLCAQIMAKELNMEMFKINISQIVSKYIGETEKNLQAVFREARHSHCILFFDECDALFGKRSEVKDAHDRNANVETAYLLQQIEEYDGVCVLATNLLQNIDEAFLRRITFVVHFPFPDAEMRQRIYRGLVAEGAPLADDIDWTFLAEKFHLSGGYIKNIVLAAAFLAAQEQSPIGMRHLLNAAVNEMKKNEIVVVREELREYADLLD